MEKLRAYLADKPKGVFASRLGTSPSYLSQLLSGRRRPSYELMLRIEQETGGAVDLRSWSLSQQPREPGS